MQTISTACAQPLQSRPGLSSDIVRPAFERHVRRLDRTGFAIGVDLTSRQGVKRASASPSSESNSYQSVASTSNGAVTAAEVAGSALVEEPFRTTQSGSNASSSFRTERSLFRDAATDKYFSRKTTAALTMVANCTENEMHDVGQNSPQCKRPRLKTERRREQCRANQARYRQKQLNHAKELELAVQKLRADIPVLKLQKNRLLYGGQQNIWNVVVEYFHVFRFGVPVTLAMDSSEVDSMDVPTDLLENAETRHQFAFLRSAMADDIILGERRGVDVLMNQWFQYSTTFQNLYLQLGRIERVNDNFMTATAMMNATVTEVTLNNVFPHLIDDHALSSRLLGQRLRIPLSLCFEWDSLSCRVSRLETTFNFIKPLMESLCNLSDVALVLENALITRDGAVGFRDL
ncbi:unnamed protein product [Phytophthora fragariaefolia]|uniref:Unnamed protein product n=1 Tax=Phytophthora fragariaefolia TaxID=1490495 RepID=A0A9W6XTE4_9STRA|nr:unnamed protein product [Phytophthora fragariaefolia]